MPPPKHHSKKKFFGPKKSGHRSGRNHGSRGDHAPIEGRLDMKGTVGFVITDTAGDTDILVQGPSLKLAMNNDRVLVKIRSTQSDGRRVGEIMKILEHAHTTVVGEFKKYHSGPFVEPENGSSPIKIMEMRGLQPKVGDMVVVRITIWPSIDKDAAGMLEKILGDRTRPGVDLEILINKFELPYKFSPEVEKEAAAYGADVPSAALEGRKTLFDKRIFTIDGADAKDFDDAVSIEPLPNNHWRLGVHIADVSSYVREKTKLDKEAYERGTSVYLSGSVIPMLPFALSDNLCSLRPDVVRLTLSCEMDVDQNGKVTAQRVFESAIKSCKRFTYDEVEAILNGEKPVGLDSRIIADVLEMGRLSHRIRKNRFSRGSLDFDFPEPYTVNDQSGLLVDIRRRQRLEAHRLIEDFMVLANETVATFMSKSPFIYRIHEKPDVTKLKALKATISASGVPVPKEFDQGNPKALQAVIEFSKDKPIQPMVQMMILRSLKQAIYSPHNKGHYGLASVCYTHFTSPIRRYPDLIVHRIVREKLQHKFNADRQKQWDTALTGIAEHTSKRERTAVEAEREFLDVQRVRLMEKQVGKKFDGSISGVTRFGIFVVLKDPFVEGLVHMTNLKDDYYFFDEIRVTLRGKRTGKVFRMGQPVKVLLAGVNLSKRQLDFELLSN